MGPRRGPTTSDQLPAIFVDRPAYGAAFANGGHIVGNANVFEATFRVAILDAGGQDARRRAGHGNVRHRLPRDLRRRRSSTTVTKAQWGTLRAYNPSAKDGSPEDVREYPVWLTPGG